MKAKHLIVILMLALFVGMTSCLSRENFFDLANDIINPEIIISYPGGGSGLYFGDVELYSSKEILITVKNQGDIELIIAGIAITGAASGEFEVDIAQMSSEVGVGGQTTFKVIFRPSATGPKEAQVTILSNDPVDGKHDFPVFGNGKESGAGPVVSVSLKNIDVSTMGAIDFGTLENGHASLPARFVIKNDGNADLRITDINVESGDFPDFNVDGLLASNILGPDQSCTFDVIFHPVGASGPKSATILIKSNALNTPNYSIDVEGTGNFIPIPDINVVQQGNNPNLLSITGIESFDFGTVSVEGTNTLRFVVQNRGTATLQVTSVDPIDTSYFKISKEITQWLIDETEDGIFEITFNPQSLIEDQAETEIHVYNDDPDSSERPYVFKVKGKKINVDVADLKVSEGGVYINHDTGTYSYGPVDIGTTATVTFKMENTGTEDLFVDQIYSSNMENFEITAVAGGDPTVVFPVQVFSGGYETFEVGFTPTDIDIFSGVITIATDDDPDLSDGFSFVVTGESSVKPVVEMYQIMDDSSKEELHHSDEVDFGDVAYGSSKTIEFEILNAGTAMLTVDKPVLESIGEDFLNFDPDTDDMDMVLDPGESTVFTVTFAPEVTGTVRNVFLKFTTNDPVRNNFFLRLKGIGTP